MIWLLELPAGYGTQYKWDKKEWDTGKGDMEEKLTKRIKNISCGTHFDIIKAQNTPHCS